MRSLTLSCLVLSIAVASFGAEPFIPRKQTKPPGPPKSPEEAVAAMTVPDGFTVELVASEPTLVNPVAMTIDERGRFWICESLEYPRREPGPGRDRVKVLEDTDGDGKIDKSTIFADGLNIPSGIAVGHGGVWIANAPDILFLQDTDGDGKADKREVVVTGFGRDDTHELPNSFTWGPDGWLYGLNGVFNPAKIEQDGKTYEFTCAVFRIHPVTRKFELFAEGTSNPWGIAFDPEGNLFVSACVIDHFWHLAETGYYQRQAGAYPPHTWILGSIVEHKHQLAAYCGLHYCDSDAFPPEWRNVFLMGNIHGNCINADIVERNGSTYRAKPREDFLSANDVWFMTVEQATGPDGSLYVLDWYDRYHCYQDANADPVGVDRLHGRLYRVRYDVTPYLPVGFDLGKESDETLIARLSGGNDFLRATARRLLAERLRGSQPEGGHESVSSTADARRMKKRRSSLRTALWDVALKGSSQQAKLNALWTLVSGDAIDDAMLLALFKHDDPALRAWGVRAFGNACAARVMYSSNGRASLGDAMAALANDSSPDVRLQVAVAAAKQPWPSKRIVETLFEVLRHSSGDPLIPGIVWQNLKPHLAENNPLFLSLVESHDPNRSAGASAILPRYTEWLLAEGSSDFDAVTRLVKLFVSNADAPAASRVLREIQKRLVTGEIEDSQRLELSQKLAPIVGPALKNEVSELHRSAVLLATAWGDAAAALIAARILSDRKSPDADRLAAAEALIAGGADDAAHKIAHLAADGRSGPTKLRGDLVAALGRSNSPTVAHAILQNFDSLDVSLQPRAIELLAQRPSWGKELVAAIEKNQISKDAVNVNQIRQLVRSSDKELARRSTAIWGTLRDGRNPERERVIAEVREQLAKTPGDPYVGQKVFARVCGQCHKIYGEGEDVGPEITRNGRNNYDQLLSNVLDPSLVIGAGYQAYNVVTSDGRVLSGLIVEDTPQRIVLKLQGGKTEAIPRNDVEEAAPSPTSLMPEGLERQISQQELADLFAFLVLDRPPSDQDAQRLPGAPEPVTP